MCVLRGVTHSYRCAEHTKQTGKSSTEQLLTQLSSKTEESFDEACELLLGKSNGKCVQNCIRERSVGNRDLKKNRKQKAEQRNPPKFYKAQMLGWDSHSAGEDAPIIHTGSSSQHRKQL